MKTPPISPRSPGVRIAAVLFAPSFFLLKATTAFSANIAGEGSALLGLNDAADGDSGTEFVHAGQSASFITDANTATYADTFGNAAQAYSYAGVLWGAPRTDMVTVLRLTFATFGDGGWFGPATSPGGGGSLTAAHLTAPVVQTTADGGTTWTAAPATTDYLTALAGHSIGGGANPFVTSKAVIFTLGGGGVTGIDGIRILGRSGGNADNGFLGVFELEVESIDNDSDNDGMDDQWELDNGLVVCENDSGTDADGDGLTNLLEFQRQTNPQDTDTDDDTLNDGPEVNTHLTDPKLADTDADGLTDGAEVNTHLTNPRTADTDGDGLTDGAEVNTHRTDPLAVDTDGDGYTDAAEVRLFSDPAAVAGIPANIAPSGTAIIGTSTAIEGGVDTPYSQQNTPGVINDALLTSRIDTFGRADEFSYVGITWPTPRTIAVDRVDLVLATFRDGGWFGPNNATPGFGGTLDETHLTVPTVQVTTDGTTWTTVAASSNYLSLMNGAVIPDLGGIPLHRSAFALTVPQAGITGIRLIGPEGGIASGGFLGVWELGVGDVSTSANANIAPLGTAIMGTSQDPAEGPDTSYSQMGRPDILNDGQYGGLDTTFGPTDAYAYAGVIWPTTRDVAIDRVECTFSIFGDGGWFGPNNFPAVGGVLSHPEDPPVLEEPRLQVTTDGGATWTMEPHTLTYLTALNGMAVPGGASPTVVFALNSPRAGINGIRLIGSEGGTGSGGFVGFREFAVKEVPATPAENIALTGTGVIGTNDAIDGDRGRPYPASGLPRHINDGDTASRVDTFDGVAGDPVSYASVFWPSGRAATVQSLTLTMATFGDGGWFGPPGAVGMAAGGNLTPEFLTEPAVQVLDASGVWNTVAATSDYLTTFNGHGIGGGANPNPSSRGATFTLTASAAGVLGARIIGNGGGEASGGFIGVFELTAVGTQAAAGADTDGDGQSDDAEAVAGTDPNNPNSVLAVTAVSKAGAILSLTWSSVPGKTYQVQTTAALSPGPWINIGSPVPASGGASTSTDVNSPSPASKEFFRVMVIP